MATNALREIWKERGPGEVGDATFDVLELVTGSRDQTQEADERMVISLAMFANLELTDQTYRRQLSGCLLEKAGCDPEMFSCSLTTLGKWLRRVGVTELREPGKTVEQMVNAYNCVYRDPLDEAKIQALVETRFSRIDDEDLDRGALGELVGFLLRKERERPYTPEIAY